MKNSIKSEDDWGPARSENRQGNVYQIKDRRRSSQSLSYINPVTTRHGQGVNNQTETVELSQL